MIGKRNYAFAVRKQKKTWKRIRGGKGGRKAAKMAASFEWTEDPVVTSAFQSEQETRRPYLYLRKQSVIFGECRALTYTVQIRNYYFFFAGT